MLSNYKRPTMFLQFALSAFLSSCAKNSEVNLKISELTVVSYRQAYTDGLGLVCDNFGKQTVVSSSTSKMRVIDVSEKSLGPSYIIGLRDSNCGLLFRPGPDLDHYLASVYLLTTPQEIRTTELVEKNVPGDMSELSMRVIVPIDQLRPDLPPSRTSVTPDALIITPSRIFSIAIEP